MIYFYGELSAPCPNLTLEDHFLPTLRYCLFNILTATLHIGLRSSICNLRKPLMWWQGPTYHAALETVIFSEAANEPRSDGCSHVTQNVENCSQSYNCNIKI